MDKRELFLSPQSLHRLLGTDRAPVLLDARRPAAFESSETMIAGAERGDPARLDEWEASLAGRGPVVVYCVHGHEVSQGVVSRLRAHGLPAWVLAGGFEEWRAAGRPTMKRLETPRTPDGPPSRWITRERPKVDRIACPWLIRRFIDRRAEILYAPADRALDVAAEAGATPFDIAADIAFSHHGDRCSFDAFLERFGLDDPALAVLAEIVRGADTARLDLAPQAAGLLAVSLGLSAVSRSDHEMLTQGCVLYDALYVWCRDGREEVHAWTPAV